MVLFCEVSFYNCQFYNSFIYKTRHSLGLSVNLHLRVFILICWELFYNLHVKLSKLKRLGSSDLKVSQIYSREFVVNFNLDFLSISEYGCCMSVPGGEGGRTTEETRTRDKGGTYVSPQRTPTIRHKERRKFNHPSSPIFLMTITSSSQFSSSHRCLLKAVYR